MGAGASYFRTVSLGVLTAAFLAEAGDAQIIDSDLRDIAEMNDIVVTVDNFVRAATDIELAKYVALAGGVNKVGHIRLPTPVDQQTTIRMNRDTLYSVAVVDISKGATVHLPETDERYMTTMVVNQDHYINDVFFGGGTYTLDRTSFDTPFVILSVRILVDAADPKDVAEVNSIQDQIKVEANADTPFILPNYDEASFDYLLNAILGLGPAVPDNARMFGPKDKVDGIRHLVGTAGGWGGLPEEEAFYLNVDPGKPVGEYKIDVPANVPVDAFWSISLYNASGFFEPNDRDAYNINSVTGTRNDDGSMTVFLGGCDDDRANCLPIMEDWNYTVRMYRPRPEVIAGTWQFPTFIRVK